MKKNLKLLVLLTLVIAFSLTMGISVFATNQQVIPGSEPSGSGGLPTPVASSGNTTEITLAPPTTVIFTLMGTGEYNVRAGEIVEIKVPLYNGGTGATGSVVGTIVDDKNNFSSVGTGSLNAPIRSKSSGYMNITVQVSNILTTGKYTAQLKLKYSSGGNPSETTVPLTFKVDSQVSATALEITDYVINKDVVLPGDAFNLAITLKNNTGVDLSNAQVTLDGVDGKKFGMNNGLTTRNINLKTGESAVVEYDIVATEGLESIREVIPVTITYMLKLGDKETAQEIKQSVSIPCKPKEKTESTTTTSTSLPKLFAPNLIIDSYSFGGDKVLAGKTFPLDIILRNTSSDTTVMELKVTIQGGAGSTDKSGIAFSPASSSNSFFFDSLAPGASTKISIVMKARADAVPDSYPVQVICDYRFKRGEQIEKTEPITNTVAIPLQQDDRLELAPPEVQEHSVVDQELNISAGLVNKGKSAVYNVSVHVEGEGFEKTSGQFYIGNIESGKEEYYDTNIIPNKEGPLKGEVVVTYEDANGTPKELRQEFLSDATVMSKEVMGEVIGGGMAPPMGDVGNNGGSNLPIPLWVIFVAGGVVILIALIVVVNIVKKKKRLALLKKVEEEDAAD